MTTATLPQTQSEMRAWLRQPEEHTTFVATAAQATQMHLGRFGARSTKQHYDTVMDAFLDAGGDEISVELTRLAGVDDKNNVIIDPSEVKSYMLRQVTPVPVNFGMVTKKEDVLEHKDLVKHMLGAMKQENGKPMKVDALLIGDKGATIVAQFPLEITDMDGETVKHNLVVYSNVKRSAGSGVMLWSMPIACTNQIPVMQMSGNNNGYTIYHPKAAARLEKLIDTANVFASTANKRMLDIYAKLSKFSLNDDYLSNLLNVLYPIPEYKMPKLTDTGLDTSKRIENWSNAKSEALKQREMIEWLMDNGNGTHDTYVRRQRTLYNYLQAVSELETKRPYADINGVTKNFISGGSRQKKIAFAFAQCLETLRRNKVSY